MRQNIYSNTPWEKKAAYSRGIKIGNHIWIAGTTAIDEQGEVVGKNDAYRQASFIFQKIDETLKKLAADFSSVVRTRMYITQTALFNDVIKAHAEIFRNIDPVSTCVVVTALVLPELLVEIEVDAFVVK